MARRAEHLCCSASVFANETRRYGGRRPETPTTVAARMSKVTETWRDAGDAQDARRTAHNPAMTAKPSGSACAECVPKRPHIAVEVQITACLRAVCKAATLTTPVLMLQNGLSVHVTRRKPSVLNTRLTAVLGQTRHLSSGSPPGPLSPRASEEIRRRCAAPVRPVPRLRTGLFGRDPPPGSRRGSALGRVARRVDRSASLRVPGDARGAAGGRVGMRPVLASPQAGTPCNERKKNATPLIAVAHPTYGSHGAGFFNFSTFPCILFHSARRTLMRSE